MDEVYLVIREEKHIDRKYVVCMEKEGALAIAKEISNYWKNEYEHIDEDIDTDCSSDEIFRCSKPNCFHICVMKIRKSGDV